jgi:hypothetical protein
MVSEMLKKLFSGQVRLKKKKGRSVAAPQNDPASY